MFNLPPARDDPTDVVEAAAAFDPRLKVKFPGVTPKFKEAVGAVLA